MENVDNLGLVATAPGIGKPIQRNGVGTIGGSAEYVDWCSPYVYPDGRTVGKAMGVGLNLEPHPDWKIQPIPKVICLFPGAMADGLVRWMEERGADVSIHLGSRFFSNQQEMDTAIRMTQINLEQQRYYIGPIDPNYIRWLIESKTPFAVAHPGHAQKGKWRFMLKKSGLKPQEIKQLMDNWDAMLFDLYNFPGSDSVQRYPVTVEKNQLFIHEVPEYLKPESNRALYHVKGFHASYDMEGGVEKNGKEPIMMVNGEIYGRVKEHTIKLGEVSL